MGDVPRPKVKLFRLARCVHRALAAGLMEKKGVHASVMKPKLQTQAVNSRMDFSFRLSCLHFPLHCKGPMLENSFRGQIALPYGHVGKAFE